VDEIFRQNGIFASGKNAVVIGAGFLVGDPVAKWLRAQGAHVEVVTSSSANMTELLKTADIVVSGAGSPHLVKPTMLKSEVILIDAATSESNGIIVGDIDPECAEAASLFTPVPGGVGPIAVALLFENAVLLAERAVNP
jgi:methylenetetrahydrofolate dehydrogenase (NADP+)/methenyltetrahydrofolate cyclohydrolase